MKKSKGMEEKFCQLIFIWGGSVLSDLLQFYEFPLILQGVDNGKSFHQFLGSEKKGQREVPLHGDSSHTAGDGLGAGEDC